MKNFINKKGATLAELIVVMGIILLIMGILAIGYSSARRQVTLERATSKLAQDVRRTQGLAITTKEVSGCAPFFRRGYGIFLDARTSLDQTKYIIFADCDDNQDYTPDVPPLTGDVILEAIEIEKGIRVNRFITNQGFPSILSIIFDPPDPLIYIRPTPVPGEPTAACIELTNEIQSRFVLVNKGGLIDVGNDCPISPLLSGTPFSILGGSFSSPSPTPQAGDSFFPLWQEAPPF